MATAEAGGQVVLREKDQLEELCSIKCVEPENIAKVDCPDCKQLFCESCLDSSCKANKKHHSVITVEDVSSGKVILSGNPQDQYCTEHDGKQKMFYCKICRKPLCSECMKQYCNDHDVVPFGQAADKKARRIKKVINQFEKIKEKLKTAISETRQTNLWNQKQLSDNKKTKEERINKMIRQELKENLAKIENACKFGTKLVESGSEFEILSNYTSIMTTLRELSYITVIPAYTTIAHSHVDEQLVTQIPAQPYVWSGKQWKLISQFSTQGDVPYSITITSSDDIAVLFFSMVKVFSRSGDVKCTFPMHSNFAITSTQDDKYVIPGHNERLCFILDMQGKDLSSFPIFDTNNVGPCPISVALDNRGNIIIGSHPETLCVHSSTGTLISRFTPAVNPGSIAVTRSGRIALVDNSGPNWLQLIESADTYILKSAHQSPKVKKWKPDAICCSKRDELFVTNAGDPKGVYMFTSDGKYLGCITTEIGESWDIVLSHDDQELFVIDLDEKMVKIFQRP